ncbi:hypothetical protein GGI03_000524, partial [Coemansia sp. RSA 2337]
ARLLKSSKIGRRVGDTAVVATAAVVVDPYADERDLAVKQYRKIPIDDLDYLQFKHVRYGQGILWALRRKLQKQANGKELPLSKGPGGTHQITEYFPAHVSKPQDSDSDVVCLDDEPKESKAEEEDLKIKWPVPLCEWQVPLPLVSRTLSVYMFISCFSVPLALNPYPLDYFESALVHSPPTTQVDEEVRVCSVYRETIVALLNSLIDDRKRNQVPANVSVRIEAMINSQDGNLSEPAEDMDVSGEDKPLEAMEIEDEQQETKASKKKVAKKAEQLLPPVAPAVLGTRSAKARASRTIAKQANDVGRRGTQASRLQCSSMLSTSSSIASEEEEEDGSESEQSDNESVESVASGSLPKGKKRKAQATRSSRRVVVASRDESSAVSSRAGSPAAASSTEEDTGSVDLANDMANLSVVLRPHELLRRLSRTWAKSAIDKAQTHWAGALVGWLMEASQDYAEELGPITSALWATPGLTLATLESALWGHILGTVGSRLLVLELLVCECANNEHIRAYLDECAEQASELKRERLECRRELKRIAETLAELDKEDTIIVGDAFSRDHSRREKELEAQRQKERRKQGEAERTHAKRLDYVERELRRLNIGRLTPLGVDRYFNKYYFIDGVGGCPAMGSGRILVQPPSSVEQAEALDMLPHFVANSWALSMPHAWTGELPLRGAEAGTLSPFIDTCMSLDLAPLARAGELWGYYATGSQVDMLKRWLDPRGGKREAALAAELDLLHPAISASLRKRCQYLEQAYVAITKARDLLTEQISVADEEEAVKLRMELDRMDSARSQLLPPHILVDRMARRDSSSLVNGNGSSRASSAEPVGIVSVVAHRPLRGRKPKNRLARVKTYMDDFLDYENILA